MSWRVAWTRRHRAVLFSALDETLKPSSSGWCGYYPIRRAIDDTTTKTTAGRHLEYALGSIRTDGNGSQRLDWSSTTPAKWIGSVGGQCVSQRAGALSAKTTAPLATCGIFFPMIMPQPSLLLERRRHRRLLRRQAAYSAWRLRCGTKKSDSLKERMFGLSNPQGNQGSRRKIRLKRRVSSSPTG